MFTTVYSAAAIDFGHGLVLTGQLEHDPEQRALVLWTHEGPEVLSTNLDAYGLRPTRPDNVFVKDWSEHKGLAHNLVETGVAELVAEHSITPGHGHALLAYELKVVYPAHPGD